MGLWGSAPPALGQWPGDGPVPGEGQRPGACIVAMPTRSRGCCLPPCVQFTNKLEGMFKDVDLSAGGGGVGL